MYFFILTLTFERFVIGSATLVASGCVVSPPMSAICLRAGWSMGSVKDRYIHHKSAGDQFVGRTVTGLSCLSTEFACSPCYFDFTEVEDEESMREMLDVHIQSNLIGGKTLTPRIRYMSNFLLACLCYHYEYLRENLHPRNQLLNSPIFSHCPKSLRECAVVKFPWNKTRDTPFLTGVPPHILIMSDMKRFETRLDEVLADLMSGFKEELDKRDVGGGMHHAVQIQDEIQKLREELKNVRVAGGRGDALGGISEGDGNMQRRATLHSYNGRFNILPQNYEIPALTLASFLVFYLIGNPNEGIPPFRIVKPIDLKRSNKDQKVNAKVLTDMRKMMGHVEKAGRGLDKWEDDATKWTPSLVTDLYEAVNWKFRIPPKRGTRRFEALTWKTYFNMVQARNGVLIGDEPPGWNQQ